MIRIIFVPIEVKAGSLIVIHGDLVHQSFEYLSSASRHAYIRMDASGLKTMGYGEKGKQSHFFLLNVASLSLLVPMKGRFTFSYNHIISMLQDALDSLLAP